MRPHLDQELQAIRASILEIGARVSGAIGQATHALLNRDLDQAREVKREDQTSDALRYAIEDACVVTMATQQPMARDLRAARRGVCDGGAGALTGDTNTHSVERTRSLR